jgi:natural product biosynthesis luciferase-like monooxygenase protein
MSGIDERLSALSPQQRELLAQRLQSARTIKSAKSPVTDGDKDFHIAGDDPPQTAFTPGKADLKWSLFFFASTDTGSAREHYRLVTECARFADRHGFEAIWFPERHFDRFGAPYPSPAILAAAVSTITERLKVRAGSVVLPLHDPLRVAEDWAVVDNLSGGRAGISFASGWHANDFVFAPDAYTERKKVLLDKLAQVRQLWAGEPVKRIDGNGQPIDVCAFPLPEHGVLPQWITSSARLETWLTAASENMNVLTGLMEQTVDEVAEKATAYHQRLLAMGLDPGQRDVTLMAHTFIGADPAQVRTIVHDPLVAYLRAHIELFAKLARSGGLNVDLDRVTEADKQALAEMAFDRYFSTHGLFGTPETALATVARFRASGVTEIACLVDFGVAPDLVLTGLTHLDELRESSAARFAK